MYILRTTYVGVGQLNFKRRLVQEILNINLELFNRHWFGLSEEEVLGCVREHVRARIIKADLGSNSVSIFKDTMCHIKKTNCISQLFERINVYGQTAKDLHNTTSSVESS